MSNLANPTDSAPGADQQARIVEVAARLFIAHGYHGVSYLHIAKELGINHSNIHYYFRVKAMLAEAVLRQVSDATLESMKKIWINPETTFLAKLLSTRNWMFEHYLEFNPGGKGGFERLEDLIKWTYTSIARAYGRRGAGLGQWVQPGAP